MNACANDETSLESQVKAAFLVKFGLFATWPAPDTNAPPDTNFVIATLGEDPFGESFDEAVKGQTVKGRAVVIRRYAELSEVDHCHVLFVGHALRPRFREILEALERRPVLTVSDDPTFTAQGGMINFIKEDGKIRFEINPDAAVKSGLKLSAKLLQVAKVVGSPPKLESP